MFYVSAALINAFFAGVNVTLLVWGTTSTALVFGGLAFNAIGLVLAVPSIVRTAHRAQ